MLKPEADIEDRTPVWDCLQDLFMDIDVTDCYAHIADICGQSKYSVSEIHDILFFEILPAVRFNLFALPIPEWRGFEITGLIERILMKNKFGKNKPWLGSSYTQQHWLILKPLIEQTKDGNHPKVERKEPKN